MAAIEHVERAAAWGARAARRLALVGAVAAGVVALYVFRDGVPEGTRGIVVALVVVALVAWPPVVLFLLAQALDALERLPRRLRDTPAGARERLGELGRLAGDAHDGRGSRFPLTLWRFLRTTASSRELLTPHAAALPLVSVPFLALSAAAIAATAVVAAVALVLLLVLAF